MIGTAKNKVDYEELNSCYTHLGLHKEEIRKIYGIGSRVEIQGHLVKTDCIFKYNKDIDEVALITGVRREVVEIALEKFNNRLSIPYDTLYRQYVVDGMTLSQLVELYGTTRQNMHKKVKKYGLDKVKAEMKEKEEFKQL